MKSLAFSGFHKQRWCFTPLRFVLADRRPTAVHVPRSSPKPLPCDPGRRSPRASPSPQRTLEMEGSPSNATQVVDLVKQETPSPMTSVFCWVWSKIWMVCYCCTNIWYCSQVKYLQIWGKQIKMWLSEGKIWRLRKVKRPRPQMSWSILICSKHWHVGDHFQTNPNESRHLQTLILSGTHFKAGERVEEPSACKDVRLYPVCKYIHILSYSWSKRHISHRRKTGFLYTLGIPHGYLMHLPESPRLFGKTGDKRREVTGMGCLQNPVEGFAKISPVQKEDSKNSSVDIIYNSKLSCIYIVYIYVYSVCNIYI